MEVIERFSAFISQFDKNDYNKLVDWIEHLVEIYRNKNLEAFGK